MAHAVDGCDRRNVLSETDTNNVRDQADIAVAAANDAPPAASIVRLWAYRRVLLVAIIVGIVVTGIVYFLAPCEHLATLRFCLLFDGADAGQYPSGAKFSTEDIVARSVLLQIHKTNDLERYGKRDAFQSVFYVAAKPSAEMEALDSEYSSKLTDRKLTAPDRTLLEQEYNEKRRGLARGVDYELTMDMSVGFGSMPDEAREKAMRDILATWARDAATRKGALKYQISILTKKFLPENILQKDEFIAADRLRIKATRILGNIDDLMELPGAKSYRSPTEDLSLGEIEASLNDVIRFKLLPAMHVVRLFGLSDSDKAKRELTELHIQGRIYEVTVSKKEAADRAKALQEALAAYMLDRRGGRGGGPAVKNAGTGATGMSVPAMIPQFGDSFLDRIIAMANESEDVKFRQDYTERITTANLAGVKFDGELQFYQDMLTAVQDKPTGVDGVTPENRKIIRDCIKEAYKDMVTHTEQINTIYTELSRKNLNPPTELYSAPEPVVTVRARSISRGKLLFHLVGIVAAMLLVASTGCLYHARIRSLKTSAD